MRRTRARVRSSCCGHFARRARRASVSLCLGRIAVREPPASTLIVAAASDSSCFSPLHLAGLSPLPPSHLGECSCCALLAAPGGPSLSLPAAHCLRAATLSSPLPPWLSSLFVRLPPPPPPPSHLGECSCRALLAAPGGPSLSLPAARCPRAATLSSPLPPWLSSLFARLPPPPPPSHSGECSCRRALLPPPAQPLLSLASSLPPEPPVTPLPRSFATASAVEQRLCHSAQSSSRRVSVKKPREYALYLVSISSACGCGCLFCRTRSRALALPASRRRLRGAGRGVASRGGSELSVPTCRSSPSPPPSLFTSPLLILFMLLGYFARSLSLSLSGGARQATFFLLRFRPTSLTSANVSDQGRLWGGTGAALGGALRR